MKTMIDSVEQSSNDMMVKIRLLHKADDCRREILRLQVDGAKSTDLEPVVADLERTIHELASKLREPLQPFYKEKDFWFRDNITLVAVSACFRKDRDAFVQSILNLYDPSDVRQILPVLNSEYDYVVHFHKKSKKVTAWQQPALNKACFSDYLRSLLKIATEMDDCLLYCPAYQQIDDKICDLHITIEDGICCVKKNRYGSRGEKYPV